MPDKIDKKYNDEIGQMAETTDDLVDGTWANSGYVELPTTGYIDPEFEAVTNQVPDDGSTRKFIQLIIE